MFWKDQKQQRTNPKLDWPPALPKQNWQFAPAGARKLRRDTFSDRERHLRHSAKIDDQPPPTPSRTRGCGIQDCVVAFVGEGEITSCLVIALVPAPGRRRSPSFRAWSIARRSFRAASGCKRRRLNSNGATGDPGDLVARALAILADDVERRQRRSNANVPRRSLR